MTTEVTSAQVISIKGIEPDNIVKMAPTLLKPKKQHKVKQFIFWVKPKNWFRRFATIDFDLEELAGKRKKRD